MEINRKPLVLVAEDNVDHLELLSDALSEDNEVMGTDSRDGCMALLSEHHFDLVVLDYNLKKKFSGFDILKEITTRYSSLPVIMVTAYGSEDLAVKVMKIGARDYIRKTLDNNYIEKIVNNVRILVESTKREKQSLGFKEIIDYVRCNRREVIILWKERVENLVDSYELNEVLSLKGEWYERVLYSLLADIQNDNPRESGKVFMDFLVVHYFGPFSFVTVELINIAFREVIFSLLKDSPLFSCPDLVKIFVHLDRIINANSMAVKTSFIKEIAGARKRLLAPLEYVTRQLEPVIRNNENLSDDIIDHLKSKLGILEDFLENLKKSE